MSIHSWSYTPKDQEQSPHSPRTQRSLSESTARSRRSSDKASVLAEQGLIEALTEHAQRIAADVLNQGDAGVNLADDIKTAAGLWMDQHPQAVLSRSQSVQEVPDSSAAEQIARSQHRKSADPSVAEYKELIRKTLSSAVAKQMGIEDGVLPDDTEISPEVMDALTNQSLTPDDLEVVQTESGRSIIQARSAASSPLKEGHLYQPAPGKNGSHPSSAKSSKPPISIPNDRQTTADIGELDVLNFGFAEQENQEGGLSPQKTSPAHSAKSRRLSDQLSVPDTEVKAPSGKRSQGSGTSQRSEKSKVSNSAKTPEQELADLMKELHVDSPGDKTPSSGKKSKSSVKSQKVSRNSLDGRDEFVVGKVEDKKELEKLYAPIEPSPPKNVPKADGKPKLKKKSGASVKTGKKGKKKEKKPQSASVSSQEVPADVMVVLSNKDKTSTPDIPVSENQEESSKYGSEPLSPAPSKSGSEDIDFVFVRDDESVPEPEVPKSPKSAKSAVPSPATLDVTDNEADISDSSSNQLHTISNKDARAAKRAAQAEKRRQEVERKRREREEQLKREKEEMERQEMLNRELEETRRRKAEERRLKKQQEEEEKNREEEMERERLRKAQQEMEREKRMKEEYQRKLEEMKRKQAEQEQKRLEEMLIRQKEEEERRLEEERMLYEMAEHERIAYEKKKKEDAERRKKEEEAARIRREEEAARALEEARKLAEEMARKQAELEARLKFNRELMLEAKGLGHTQDITRAFVYSYFELLQWLGLDIPEFDLQKLQAKF